MPAVNKQKIRFGLTLAAFHICHIPSAGRTCASRNHDDFFSMLLDGCCLCTWTDRIHKQFGLSKQDGDHPGAVDATQPVAIQFANTGRRPPGDRQNTAICQPAGERQNTANCQPPRKDRILQTVNHPGKDRIPQTVNTGCRTL